MAVDYDAKIKASQAESRSLAAEFKKLIPQQVKLKQQLASAKSKGDSDAIDEAMSGLRQVESSLAKNAALTRKVQNDIAGMKKEKARLAR